MSRAKPPAGAKPRVGSVCRDSAERRRPRTDLVVVGASEPRRRATETDGARPALTVVRIGHEHQSRHAVALEDGLPHRRRSRGACLRRGRRSETHNEGCLAFRPRRLDTVHTSPDAEEIVRRGGRGEHASGTISDAGRRMPRRSVPCTPTPSPCMWNSGNARMRRSSRSTHAISRASALDNRLPCDSTTPFGVPSSGRERQKRWVVDATRRAWGRPVRKVDVDTGDRDRCRDGATIRASPAIRRRPGRPRGGEQRFDWPRVRGLTGHDDEARRGMRRHGRSRSSRMQSAMRTRSPRRRPASRSVRRRSRSLEQVAP